jgi:hypothetical protein
MTRLIPHMKAPMRSFTPASKKRENTGKQIIPTVHFSFHTMVRLYTFPKPNICVQRKNAPTYDRRSKPGLLVAHQATSHV